MLNVAKTVGSIVLIMSFFILMMLHTHSFQEDKEPAKIIQLQTGISFRSDDKIPSITFIDHSGLKWSPDRIYGRWSLFFFGYSQCPEFCPKLLEQMDQIGQKFSTSEMKCLFVSIDPDRDSPEQLDLFLERYRTPILGLHGSAQDVSKLANFFKIHIEEAKGTEQHIEHAAAFVLVDPLGRPCAVFTSLDNPAQVIQDIHIAQTQFRSKNAYAS